MGRMLFGVVLLNGIAAMAVDAPKGPVRGRYIFLLTDCGGCHMRDGKGQIFPATLGLPGNVVAPNITPDKSTGLENWTDAEKIRAIRQGLGRDGRVLFPMMPYHFYRTMSDADVTALVAYLNSLPPVRNPLPRTSLPPGMAFPAAPPVGPVPEPDRKNKLKYGEYLTTIGACADCHTPEVRGQPVRGMLFAGGRVFRFPQATVVSANITPDPDTGIGQWTEVQFVNRFYAFRQYAGKELPAVGPGSFTIMPWIPLSQLTREDLEAIYAYLKTQTPVRNKVDVHLAARQ